MLTQWRKCLILDVTLNGSREAGVLRDSIRVELDPNNPSNAQYFKPGFPYRGQVTVISTSASKSPLSPKPKLHCNK